MGGVFREILIYQDNWPPFIDRPIVLEKLPKGGHATIATNYEVLLNHFELYNMIKTYSGWKNAIFLREKELLEKTIYLKQQIDHALD